MKIVVIIPAFNEQDSIELVIKDIPPHIDEVIVINNNSTDNTSMCARNAGATVLLETRAGYGSACLKGLQYVSTLSTPPDIVVFIDGDYSDHPEELPQLIAPILAGRVDMVIGSRALGNAESGAMMPQQIFGNWIATKMIKHMYGLTYTDLGPFRAIRYDQLLALKMIDTNFGWTVEMQVKAIKQKLRIEEIPVKYRKRIGVSKIAGTVKGTIGAGYKIITTILKYR